ncbi:MAG: P27 family phage terminase small subunit [Planctomycetota bacterium]
MGTRGPSPTPTRLLQLRGSWRAKQRVNEPRPRRTRPRPPATLGAEAKKGFLSLVRQLYAQHVVVGLDAQSLARYADLLVDYWKAAEFVAKHGAVYVVRGKPAREGEQGPAIGFRPYPQMALKIALASELLRLEREFGLTPSARARVEVEAPVPAEPAFHYFDATEVG